MTVTANDKLMFLKSEDGDWIGLYVNGKLMAEGHSLDPVDLLENLGFDVTREERDADWFDDNGGTCPEEWTEGSTNLYK